MQLRLYPIATLLALASSAVARDTIIIRSGSFGNAPAATGTAIDNGTCIAATIPLVPLSSTAFGPEFSAACAGAAPIVVTAPPTTWIQSLPCDPEARWINPVMHPTELYGEPRSALYCFPFNVDLLFGSSICEAHITLCWAADDQLGDPSSPNPIGVYLNNTPLSNAFKGGGRLVQTTAAQSITTLVNPGLNHLYLYQRDLGAGVSGIMFSAKIVVNSSPPCSGGDVVLELVSGQFQGSPQVVGGVVDNALCLGSGVSLVPYQNTPFTPGDLNTPCQQGNAPVVIQPHPSWIQSLSCNPEARWIHTSSGIFGLGDPPESVLYCIPVDIPFVFCNAQLELCWAADDFLGDSIGANPPNPIGAYINGVPLDPTFAGGNYTTETSAIMNVTSLLSNVGMNNLVLYQRDAGHLVSGIIYSARFTFTPRLPCPPPWIGLNYCGPAAVNSTGLSATISAVGSTLVSSNDLILIAESLPTSSFAYFLASRMQGFVTNPGGSAGNICLGGSIGRVVGGAIVNSGALGSVAVAANLGSMPQPTGPVIVVPGDTWNFQTWYRDSVGGVSTSNFTDGVSVLFN
jgi:hypothetical protein